MQLLAGCCESTHHTLHVQHSQISPNPLQRHGVHLQGQGFRRVEIFEGSMDNIHKGMEDMLRELQGAFSFGFGMFPELEEHMTGEMRRLFRPDASTSGRWASLFNRPTTSSL